VDLGSGPQKWTSKMDLESRTQKWTLKVDSKVDLESRP
jgi:hypothetical protein